MGDSALMAVPSAKAGLEDMALLFDYLEVYGVLDKVSHLSLTASGSGGGTLHGAVSISDPFIAWPRKLYGEC